MPALLDVAIQLGVQFLADQALVQQFVIFLAFEAKRHLAEHPALQRLGVALVVQPHRLDGFLQQLLLPFQHLGHDLRHARPSVRLDPAAHEAGQRQRDEMRDHQHLEPFHHRVHQRCVEPQAVVHETAPRGTARTG